MASHPSHGTEAPDAPGCEPRPGRAKMVYAPRMFTAVYDRYGDAGILALVAHALGHALDDLMGADGSTKAGQPSCARIPGLAAFWRGATWARPRCQRPWPRWRIILRPLTPSGTFACRPSAPDTPVAGAPCRSIRGAAKVSPSSARPPGGRRNQDKWKPVGGKWYISRVLAACSQPVVVFLLNRR